MGQVYEGLTTSDITHIRGMTLDGLRGASPTAIDIDSFLYTPTPPDPEPAARPRSLAPRYWKVASGCSIASQNCTNPRYPGANIPR